jgi:hypothetical protein
MTDQNQPYSEAVRTLARSIAQRSADDPAYAQQLQDNPVATLKAAGLEDDAIGQFIAESGIEGEVSGYSYRPGGICILTIVDICTCTGMVQ